MLKGFSNIKLIGILAALVGIYFIIQFTGGKSRSESFRSSLVEIDTAKVSTLKIEKDGKTLTIEKVGSGNWEMELENGKKVSAKPTSVRSALQSLTTIKPSRLASKDPAKWSEYQVDSAGTRVTVFEDNEEALDIILGRFGVKDQRSYHTFVRLEDEKEVYTADNFMGVSFSSDASNFREQMFLRVKKDSLHTIEFNYPDSAFVLTKTDGYWYIDGNRADSTSAAEFINQLSYTTSKEFVDDVEQFGESEMSIVFKSCRGSRCNHKRILHHRSQYCYEFFSKPNSLF